MQLDFVDRLNGRAGIGVSCQQDTAGMGIDLHGLGQEFDTAHLGHAMIGEQQRYGIVALFQFSQQMSFFFSLFCVRAWGSRCGDSLLGEKGHPKAPTPRSTAPQ